MQVICTCTFMERTPPEDVLDNLPTDRELMQRRVDKNDFIIDNVYEWNCDLVVFMRKVMQVSSKERMVLWRERYSEQVKVITKLEGCGMQSEESVRAALATIFSVLSDEVHQASARFEGDGSFLLPRAGTVFTIPQIFAMASIVSGVGLTPVYPDVKDVLV